MDYHYAKERDPKVIEHFDEEVMKAFMDWNSKVMAPGKLDKKTKELVAVACTYMTRCPYCIEGHAKAAIEAGATKEELAEIIQIAMALAAGARIAHRNFALDV
jgi:AhpD family alkylhydroperoxidase